MRQFHCEHLGAASQAWLRLPCGYPAAIVYRDADGVHHGYCREHMAEGRRLALVRHWTEPPVGLSA